MPADLTPELWERIKRVIRYYAKFGPTLDDKVRFSVLLADIEGIEAEASQSDDMNLDCILILRRRS